MKKGPSAEEIAKIKQEWEEKEKRKKLEKEKKDKEIEKEDDDKGKQEGKGKAPEETKHTEASATAPGQSPTPPPKSTHERYVLHRDIFSLRVAEHRRRRQTAQAKTLAPLFPGTPTNTIR